MTMFLFRGGSVTGLTPAFSTRLADRGCWEVSGGLDRETQGLKSPGVQPRRRTITNKSGVPRRKDFISMAQAAGGWVGGWVAADLMSLACDICRADWKWPEARVCRLRRCGLSTGDQGCRLSLGREGRGGALSAAAAAAAAVAAWVSRCPATVLSAAVDTGAPFYQHA